jgi:hypothetical protein
MKLEEAFIKYTDTQMMRRKNWDPRMRSKDVGYLKECHVWYNEESRQLGFIIFQCMIDDHKADDWELVEEVNQ